MIRFPLTLDEALDTLAAVPNARIRAGGVDDHVLRARGLVGGPVVDLRDLPGHGQIESTRDGLRIGALVTMEELATHEAVVERYPALAQAAAAIGTPQVRGLITVGGNLLQQVRCWYLRNASFTCLKQGGATCYAREGDHSEHSVFDYGACVAPHPSTLAMVAALFDGLVELDGRDDELWSVPELLGDGTDPRRTHALPEGSVLTALVLPEPERDEASAYVRTTARARAEWALVEAAVRIELDSDGLIERARVFAGGVAVRPLRLEAVEEGLLGLSPTDGAVGGALAQIGSAAPGLPQAAYKARLLPPTLQAALMRAVGPEPEPDSESEAVTPSEGATSDESAATETSGADVRDAEPTPDGP